MTVAPFYLFIHIPKSAGTTLRSIVDCQYGRDNVLTYYNQTNRHLLDNLDAVLTVRRHEYKALIGHFSFGVHDNLSHPARYITFLRDPVSRAVSSYYENLKTNTGNFSHPDGTLMSLEYCVEHMEDYFSNQQLRMVGGFEGGTPLNEDLLHQTLGRINDHFAFVGSVEKFNESLLLLSKKIGWRPCEYRPLNVRRVDVNLNAATLERISELNALEIQLYQHTCGQLEAMISDQGDTFHQAVIELNDLGRRWEEHSVGLDQEAAIVEAGLIKVRDYLDLPPGI